LGLRLSRRTPILGISVAALLWFDVWLVAGKAKAEDNFPTDELLIQFDIWVRDEWAWGPWDEAIGEPAMFDPDSKQWSARSEQFGSFDSFLADNGLANQGIVPEVSLPEEASWNDAMEAMRNLARQGQCYSLWPVNSGLEDDHAREEVSFYTVQLFREPDGELWYCYPGKPASIYDRLSPGSLDDRLHY
jgi:hypothetical protein